MQRPSVLKVDYVYRVALLCTVLVFGGGRQAEARSQCTLSQQPSVTFLGSGTTRSSRVGRNEFQAYSFDLAKGQYADIVFTWQGLNLNVALLDPDGRKLLPDIQVTSPGPVVVSVLANKTGTYTLRVTTPVKQKVSGTYEVKLSEPRLPTTADQHRLAAQTLIAEAQVATTTSGKVDLYSKASNLLHDAGDTSGEARVLLLIGDIYRNARELDAKTKIRDAALNYEQAAELWQKTGYLRGSAYAKISLGLLHRSLGSLADAIPHYEQARLLFAQINDHRGEADALYGLAFTLALMGQTLRAIDTLQETIEIRRAINDRLGEASALNALADLYRVIGDHEKSLSTYALTEMAMSGLEHYSLEATVINGKAVLYDDEGNFQQSRDEYTAVLELYRTLLGPSGLNACIENFSASNTSNCKGVIGALVNRGETYNTLGDPEQAKLDFEFALRISEALDQPVWQGLSRFHLGYAYFRAGDVSTALKYYNEAEEIQRNADASKDLAITYTYMGMAHVARNEPARALEYYRKALPIQEASRDKRGLAITLDKLATAYALTNNRSEASLNYAKALDLWRAIKDADGEALTLYNLATFEQSAGNFREANRNVDAAINVVEDLRTRVTNEQLRSSYRADKQDYYQLNVELKMQLSQSGKLGEFVGAAFDSSERAKARNLLDVLNDAGIDRANANAPSPELSKLIEQQKSVSQLLALKAHARTTLLVESPPPELIKAIDREIDQLTKKYDDLSALIRSKNPRFAELTRPEPATLKTIQQTLDDDTLLLEYSLGLQRSYLFTVSPNSIQAFPLPGSADIEAAATRITHAITARNRKPKDGVGLQQHLLTSDAEYESARFDLSRMVLQPAAALLSRKRVVIVADGILQTVSFADLPLTTSDSTAATSLNSQQSHSSDALLGQHEIVVLPSASVLTLQRRYLAKRTPAPYALAVLADPVFDPQDSRVAAARLRRNARKENGTIAKILRQSEAAVSDQDQSTLAAVLRDVGLDDGRMRRLTFSRQEALSIKRAVPADQVLSALDFEASRATAISPKLAKYRIIHFATHGLLDPRRPALSGIVLSTVDENGQTLDGYLRLYDIYNLNLPAELVVLSACQTGIGKQIRGEGLMALTRGFMYAGARSVVGSLWKVDDAATAALMADFYKQMFVNKLKPAAALRQAQLTISHQKRWQSPYYWAGFFLQGDWN